MIPERPAIVQFRPKSEEGGGFERPVGGGIIPRNKRGTIPPLPGGGEIPWDIRLSRCEMECGKGTSEGPCRRRIIAQMFWISKTRKEKFGDFFVPVLYSE